MTKIFKLLIIFISAALLTSCDENIMNSSLYSSKADQSAAGSYYLGYWKSNIITIDSAGEIDQNIYLQDRLDMTSSNKGEFDEQLNSYDCSQTSELESAQKIDAQVFIFFHHKKYYMVANLVYTTDDGEELRCTGTLGQGNYISDANDYLSLEDIQLGLHAFEKNAGSFALEFLR